ncbi:MAG: YbhB/YbcL family Raf kinase inhibitor-like protein [Deltaproteobacteria bacterium]|nr:YbhB/YbcL family Raf kinase inhibitor-like protein [Deltaproteobacteria bacterium]MBW2075659.1 YbhB/YbcL family Raf kinase inhibitor-like protein [Deltaproteobacteria bacterium]
MARHLFRISLVFLLTLACTVATQDKGQADQVTKLQVESAAFKAGDTIPKRYTCDGADVSPPLAWSAPPEGTEQLVLICDDPDAPGRTWVHWVLFGLSPNTLGVPEDVPQEEVVLVGAKQGRNDFGRIGYGGPCPPRGMGTHRYFFKVYAVDLPPHIPAGATKAQVIRMIRGHILAEGQLMGRYGR